jgi:hypothetical protein
MAWLWLLVPILLLVAAGVVWRLTARLDDLRSDGRESTHR